jgi:hypothetical protein
MSEVTYDPWVKSREFHAAANHPTINVVALITGAGYGKTYALCAEVIDQVLRKGYGSHGPYLPYLALMIEPTYPMIEDVMLPIWFSMWPESQTKSWNDSKKKLVALNGAEVHFRNAYNAKEINKWRGTRPNIIAIDEARLMDEYAFTLALNRVSFRNGKVLVVSTPNGMDWTYDKIELPAKTDRRFRCYAATAYDNPMYSSETLDQQADLLGDDLAAQEVYGKRVAFSGRVYRHFDEARHIGTVRYRPEYPVAMAVDFNVDPLCAALMHPLGRDGWQCFGEVVLRHSDTDELCRVVKSRYPDHKAEWLIYPDPSGKASHTSSAGRSDHSILQEYLGPNCIRARTRAPAIRDRVAALNRLFRAGSDGKEPTRFVVDPICKTLIKGLSTIGWKGNIPDEQIFEGHITAALGYAEEFVRPFGLGGLQEAPLKNAKQLRRDKHGEYET